MRCTLCNKFAAAKDDFPPSLPPLPVLSMRSARRQAACDSTFRSFVALGDENEEDEEEDGIDEVARRFWMSSLTTGNSNMSDSKEAERA